MNDETFWSQDYYLLEEGHLGFSDDILPRIYFYFTNNRGFFIVGRVLKITPVMKLFDLIWEGRQKMIKDFIMQEIKKVKNMEGW
jgi:hypothetical protein